MYVVIAYVVVGVLFYLCLIKPFQYWSRKGVDQKSVVSVWMYNLRFILQLKAPAEIIQTYYNDFSNKRYYGTYQFFSPILFVTDPDLIKQITIQNFDHFVDHNQSVSEEREPLWGKNLVALKGDRWRQMRATLSPSFTSSKMRSMFTLIADCSTQFVEHFNTGKDVYHIDVKDVCTRFANDVIASTAFGVTCNSLKEPKNEFYIMGNDATNFRGLWRGIKFFLIMFAPNLVKWFGIQLFSKSVTEFFRRLVKTNIESREKLGTVRPDMIQLLMEARKERLKYQEDNTEINTSIIENKTAVPKNKWQTEQLTDDDLTAQALIFFFAGFETTSTFMCFLFYELAINPDIQEKLRKEVKETLRNCNGCLTYDILKKMNYMDMVVLETLRKWPPAIAMDRVCVKPYTIQPVLEGEKPIYMKKGDLLWIPTYVIHRNPKFYPNPEKFDPERFNEANKTTTSYAYLPFGMGPRSCIGNRFALLETKTLLFYLLSRFEITPTEKTEIPLQLATNQFNIFSKNGFYLALKVKPAV